MVVKKEVLEEYGWKDPSLGPWDWKKISQALHEGLKNRTKKLFTNVWWKANPLAVSYSTLVMQFALRFTSVQLKTFWFVVFALLGWFGFFFPFQLSHFLFIEIQCLNFPAQFGSVIKCPGTSLRQLKSAQGKHNSQGDLPLSGIHRLSPTDCYSSPPKLLFPLPQLLQPFLWRLSQASPSLLKAGATAELPSPNGSVSKELSLTLTLPCCDFTHAFLLEKQLKSHRQ